MKIVLVTRLIQRNAHPTAEYAYSDEIDVLPYPGLVIIVGDFSFIVERVEYNLKSDIVYCSEKVRLISCDEDWDFITKSLKENGFKRR